MAVALLTGTLGQSCAPSDGPDDLDSDSPPVLGFTPEPPPSGNDPIPANTGVSLVASAGVDFTVVEGQEATLDGSASTSTGDHPMSYIWQQTSGPDVTLVDATLALARFVAPGVDADTTLTFELLVGDGTASAVDSISITVTPVPTPAGNDSPVAVAGADFAVNEGQEATLDGSASTSTSAQPMSYTWAQTGGSEVVLLDASSAVARFVAPSVDEDTALTFELTVSDGLGIATDTVNVRVANVPGPAETEPALGIVASITAGTAPLLVEFEAVTLDGLPLPENATYSWNFDDGVEARGPRVSHVFLNARSYPYAVTLCFAAGAGLNSVPGCSSTSAGARAHKEVQVAPAPANHVAIIGHIWNGSVGIAGVPVSVGIDGVPDTSTDQNGVYALSVPVGSKAVITPSSADHTFSPVSRSYPEGVTTSLTGQDFTATPVNIPPVASSQFVITEVNQSVSITLAGQSPKSGVLSFAIVSLPKHGTLADASGPITAPRVCRPDVIYTAGKEPTESERFEFLVDDGVQQSPTAIVSITIKPASVVATPTISPNGGNFVGSVLVTLDCATPGATVRYTTNGSDPSSGSAAYTSAFTLTNSATVKARGFASGYTYSAAASAAFTVNPVSNDIVISGSVQSPSASPIAGVSISAVGSGTSSGRNSATSTAADGRYQITVGTGWSGTLTPSLSGYSFSPGSLSFTNLSGNQTDKNFIASAIAPVLAPTITQGGSLVLAAQTDVEKTINLSATDSNAQPDSLVWTPSTPQNGSVTITSGSPSNSGGVVTVAYQSNAGFVGTDGFLITVTDADGNSDSITITVNVNASGTVVPGICGGDSFSATIYQDSPFLVQLTAIDSDAPPQSLHWSVSTSPQHGATQTVSGAQNSNEGTFRFHYIPSPGYLGSDSLTVTVTDGNGATDSAAVNITVVALQAPRQYYVSPSGSDTNTGLSDASAFKTIQKAANVVKAGDTVFVMNGTYQEEVTLSKNGTPANRITFTNYPGHQPVIDAEFTRPRCVHFRGRAPGGAHHVTVQGLQCKNFLSIGIEIVGTEGAEVRNNRVYRESPETNGWAGTGINVTGPNFEALIEGNHVYNLGGGIRARYATGDYRGSPRGLIFRYNHVHHIRGATPHDSNNAHGIGPANATEGALIEHNLAHHVDDNAFVENETWSGTVFRYNISYLGGPVDPAIIQAGGGGCGCALRTKPWATHTNVLSHPLGPYRDLIHHNIAFLNPYGIDAYSYEAGWAHRVYNNISVLNSGSGDHSGLTWGYGSNLPPEQAAEAIAQVKNNIVAGNERNITLQGVIASGASNNLSGELTLPGFANISLLQADANNDGTPDVLDPLNDPDAFPDGRAAVEYVAQTIRGILAPPPGSPAIDGGVIIPGLHCSTSGPHPGEDCQEWYGSAPDIGAYEYNPDSGESQ